MKIGIGQMQAGAPPVVPTMLAQGHMAFTIPDYAEGSYTSSPAPTPIQKQIIPFPSAGPQPLRYVTPAPTVHTVARTPAHRKQKATGPTAVSTPTAIGTPYPGAPPAERPVMTPQSIVQTFPSITDALAPEYIATCSQWEDLNASIAQNPLIAVAVALGIFVFIRHQKRKR